MAATNATATTITARDWADMPFEILKPIFLELQDNQDAQNCQLTCKKWFTLAQERFYRMVALTSAKQAKNFFIR